MSNKIIAPIVILLVLCGGAYFYFNRPATVSDDNRPDENAGATVSEKVGQEYKIAAADGGSIKAASAKISFPPESLKSDADIVVSDMPGSTDPDVVAAGFELKEKGKTSGPEMTSPALILFALDDADSSDISIFRYTDDGYDLIPSHVAQKDGKTVVYAGVTHFSSYGARKMKDGESVDKSEYADYDWIIYVKDSADADSGGMQRKVNLDFKATNTSGDIAGPFNGYARASVTNDGERNGGKIDADFQVSDDNVSFKIGPYIELGSLVPEDPNDPLAKLEPEKQPDFLGHGSISMRGSGSGTVTARGYSFSRGLEASATTDPFEIYIVGSLVRLSVTIADTGTLYFDGFIRGEAKK